jgi:lipopolysaccharide export system ATP-binding protein
MTTLSVKGLVKNFGRKAVIRGVSFSMEMGEIVGLLGPNGAGKTTIFYMIVGFIKPTSGEIFLNDKEISKEPMFRRAREGIAYLPQEASVFRKMSVAENIWAVLEMRKDLTHKEKKAELEELLAELGIEKIRRQKAYTLSGGERRRTEIARALAIKPKFLLLDEPFAGIDPIAVSEIKRIVRELSAKGIGILITDHSVHYTLEITKRSYIINLGEIVTSGTKRQLLKSKIARTIYLGEDFMMH